MSAMDGWTGLEALRRLLGLRRDERRELILARDGAWSLVVGRRGAAVRCTAGLLLVTSEGDPEDHVLAAGEALAVRRPGRLAVWALQPSRAWVDRPGAWYEQRGSRSRQAGRHPVGPAAPSRARR